MTCDKLFLASELHRRDILDAPVRIYPKCHPKAHINVFCDSERAVFVLCCSKCDRVIDEVKTKWTKHGNMDPPTSKGV